MKQVFITTKIDSLKDLFKDTDWETHAHDFKIPHTISDNGLTVNVVSDELEFPSNHYHSTIDKENDGILYHDSSFNYEDNGITKVKNSVESNFNNRKGGSHTDGSLHQGAFKIIFDNDQNKAKRIIEFLFPPEEAKLDEILDFLHQCLMPNDAQDATLKDSWWQDKNNNEDINVKNKTKVKDAFDKLKNLNTTDPFDKSYLETLTTLRDTLLN